MKNATSNNQHKNNLHEQPMDAKEFCSLAGAMTADSLEKYLGVSPATLRRWKSGRARIPVTAAKLMRIRFGNEVTDLLGKDWEGYHFGCDGKLYVPGWRNGFEPYEIKAMFFTVQLVKHHESTIRGLEQRIASLEHDLIEATETAAKYRRLVSSESSFGLAFGQIIKIFQPGGNSQNETT